MVDAIIYGVLSGIWGYLLAEVLTMPGEVLFFYRNALERITWNKQDDYGHYWIWKITVGCSKCIAGNISFIVVFFHGMSIGQAFVTLGLSVFTGFLIDRTL